MTRDKLPSDQRIRFKPVWLWVGTACAGVMVTALSTPLDMQREYAEAYSTWPISLVSLLAGAFILLGPVFYMIVAAVLWKRNSIHSLIPLLLCCGTGVTVFYGNLDPRSWWLHYNEWRHHEQRLALYKAVALGQLTADSIVNGKVTYDPALMLSQAGDSALVKQTLEGPLLFFYTFTGLPDGMAGFIYTPPGTDPKTAWPELQLQCTENWSDDGSIHFGGNS